VKNTYQLTFELESFLSFVLTLQDKQQEFYLAPLLEHTSIKAALASVYVQDKLYVEHYFPQISKDVVLPAHNKRTEKKQIYYLESSCSFKDLVLQLNKSRRQLISLLNAIPQERMHAFFKIENVSFTMYDHIERIIWNDGVIMNEIKSIHLN